MADFTKPIAVPPRGNDMARPIPSYGSEQTAQGRWYVPGDPGHAAFGSATFVPGSEIIVEFYETVPGEEATELCFGDLKGYPVLLGEVNDGPVALLQDVQLAHGSYGASSSFRGTARLMALGIEDPPDPEQLGLEWMEVSFTRLEPLFGHTAVKWTGAIGLPDPQSWPVPREIEPWQCEFRFENQDARLTLGDWRRWADGQTHFHYTCELALRIEPLAKQPVLWFVRASDWLRRLLVVLSSRPVQIRMVYAAGAFVDVGGSPRRRPAEVYLASRPVPSSEQTLPQKVVASCREQWMPSLFEQWFARRDDLRSPISALVTFLEHGEGPLAPQIADLSHALEAFHRCFFGGAYMTPEEWAPFRNALVGAVPSALDNDHRKSLVEGRLKYGYEYSLGKRLAVLAKATPDAWGILPSRKQDRREFLDRVRDIRNGVAHPAASGGQVDPNVEELIVDTFRLVAWLHALVLENAGMPGDAIGRGLAACGRYAWALADH